MVRRIHAPSAHVCTQCAHVLQVYATSTKQLQPHSLETPIFLSSKWLAIGDLRCMDEALLILLIVIH